jgi:hypothetical protein
LGEAQMGPENPEQVAAKEILLHKKAKIDSQMAAPSGGIIYTGVADRKPVELLIDADGRIKRGKCVCSHHFKAGIRMGPCRHLLALRWLAWKDKQAATESTTASWYERLKQWTHS